eukprot:2294766-Pleurochrysis_carterae.AAC.2
MWTKVNAQWALSIDKSYYGRARAVEARREGDKYEVGQQSVRHHMAETRVNKTAAGLRSSVSTSAGTALSSKVTGRYSCIRDRNATKLEFSRHRHDARISPFLCFRPVAASSVLSAVSGVRRHKLKKRHSWCELRNFQIQRCPSAVGRPAQAPSLA